MSKLFDSLLAHQQVHNSGKGHLGEIPALRKSQPPLYPRRVMTFFHNFLYFTNYIALRDTVL